MIPITLNQASIPVTSEVPDTGISSAYLATIIVVADRRLTSGKHCFYSFFRLNHPENKSAASCLFPAPVVCLFSGPAPILLVIRVFSVEAGIRCFILIATSMPKAWKPSIVHAISFNSVAAIR